jgi:AraC-like DNA-binding protein
MGRIEQTPEWVERIRHWIMAHYFEKLSLDSIAQNVAFLSKCHMCYEFKRWAGQSIFGLVSQVRMDAAKNLLRYTNIPISSIANRIGYTGRSTFARHFRNCEGVSPGAYRRQWHTPVRHRVPLIAHSSYLRD